jgi:hypothetical protein
MSVNLPVGLDRPIVLTSRKFVVPAEMAPEEIEVLISTEN